MSQLQIRLFGGFQVHLDEQPIRFPTQKVRALFAYLSVEAQSAHPREKLMTLFWPEQSQNSASNNLRQTLSRLRSVLPADTLLIRDNKIQFNPKTNHRIDVTAFVQTFNTKALDDMAAASELYQGDFLAHFSLLDSPIFEEWALLKREWLRSEALKMLHHLTLAYEQAERHEDAIHAARRQVEIDSLHEVAWQQLMRNLALAGRRSEALDQFELCRQILEKELEVEPAQETTQLAQQIRAGGFAPKSIGQPSQLASLNETIAPTRLFNLPTPLTPLVGREVELAHLAELLAEPSIRLLTILGPGGMGKTHLALAAVAAEKEHFANGVAFVSLAPLQSSEAVVSAIAASLRFSFHNNGDPLSQLRDYLREKAFLLLLDNFEHLLSATAILIDLLEHAPRLNCLATSRVALGTIGEQLFMLDGVTVPPSGPKTLAEVDRYGAVRLFVQSAKRLNPTFRLDTQVQPAVIAICRHVQGMPLGILLATAWLQTLSLDEIVTQLNNERRDSASERLDFWALTNLPLPASNAACAPSLSAPGVCSANASNVLFSAFQFFVAALLHRQPKPSPM